METWLVWGRTPSPVQAEQSSAAHLARILKELWIARPTPTEGCPIFARSLRKGGRQISRQRASRLSQGFPLEVHWAQITVPKKAREPEAPGHDSYGIVDRLHHPN